MPVLFTTSLSFLECIMKKIIFLLSLCLLPLTATAVDLEYKGFYKRLDLIKENNFDLITMGFYLVDTHNRSRCKLTKATMFSKGERAQDIQIADDGQMLVPLSEELYKKQAFLRVTQDDERQSCTLQMQIQAKDKQQTAFTYKQLSNITWQMQELVDEFGSFLWFMMPNVQGLHINIENPSQISFVDIALKPSMSCTNQECKLKIDTENQSEEKALEFISAPIVIAPWIEEH